MATASSSKGGAYEGAGGKFRKKAFKTPTTPYSRPPPPPQSTALQAAKHAFKSKIVDPASRIITRSAQHLFSSLFRKRLTAPPIVLQEQRDEVQEADTNGPDCGAQPRVNNELAKRSSGSESNSMNEIEEVLRQKTFTKAEVDRLTELLHSKTVTGRANNDKKVPEPSPKRAEAVHDFQYRARLSVQENTVERQRTLGATSAVPGNSSVVQSDVASAAELAKAYMGDVPSHTSPTNLESRSQIFRKDVPLLTNTQYTPRSSGLPLENGYTMQRPRGRSAIYHMARTPNPRVHDTDIRKINGYATSPQFQGSWENGILSNGKQPLKRRSSILNSDIGSIGPIRRVRQKTNMMSPSLKLSSRNVFTDSGSADGSEFAQGSRSVGQKQMFLNGSRDSISNLLSVPSQSTKIAEKIRESLEKSSPKEKLSVLKVAVARDKAPSMLTEDMLNGKARRSLEHIDSSKLLKEDTFNGLDSSQSRGTQDSPQKQAKFENSNRLIASSNKKLAPKVNGERKASKENASNGRTPDSATSSFAPCPSEQTRAFRMSAHEDFLDLDDDSDNGGVDLPTEKEKKGKFAVDTNAVAAEVSTSVNSTVSSEMKSPTSSSSLKPANTKEKNAPTTAEKDSSFTFQVTPTSSATTHPSSATQAPPFQNGVCSPKEVTPAPSLDFGSKSTEKAGLFKLSPQSSAFNNPVDPIFGSQSDSKFMQNSLASVPVPVTVSDTPVAIKSDGSENLQKSRELFGGSENFVPPAASTSAPMNMFSSGPSKDGTNVNNGPFSVPSRLPIPAAQVSTGSSQVIFSAATSTSSTIADPNTNTAVSNTPPKPSTAVTTPTFNAVPPFKFGSNSAAAPSYSSLLPSSTSGTESTNSEPKNTPIPSFGSLTSAPFGGSSSSGFTSSGSGIVNFGSSTTSSASNLSSSPSSQSPSSNPFGSSFGSPFGAQTKTEAAPLSQSVPNPFAATALPSTIGQGASSSVSTSSSPFGSAPATSIFGSSSGFGSSSSTSTGASPFRSSSSSSLFGSSLPSGTSSSTVSSFGTVTSTAGFSFGLSAPNSSTSLFGSSSLSGTSSSTSSAFGTATSTLGFSFGASSAAASNTSASVFGSSFASGTAPSTNSVFGTSSTGFSFGGSSAAAVSTSSTPPVFGFAATTPSPSPSVFGTPSPAVQFGSTPHSNDQADMDYTMAEDTVQASTPGFPPDGQPPNQPNAFNFGFGSPALAYAPSGGSPFQFDGQQNLGAPQNPSLFQASGNLEFSVGRSFSLGSGDADKSNRKFIRVNRNRERNNTKKFIRVNRNKTKKFIPSPFQASGNLEFSAGSSFSLGSGGADKSNRKFIRVNRNKTRKR